MVIKRNIIPDENASRDASQRENVFKSVFVSHGDAPGCISLVEAFILVDRDDFEGIQIAASNLSKDFGKVTGRNIDILFGQPDTTVTADVSIIIGSISRSVTIQNLINEGKLDVSTIEKKWECYVTCLVDNPLKICKKALVIAGSDKRGTIFGTYTLSEQIGVSPWYWWADVPPKKSSSINALNVHTKDGPPSVKYRGIFLNDEAPSLSGWVHEKFGPVYDSKFYAKVFELLLRLKANFLWPAMWSGFPQPGNSFFVDDPLNQNLADKYGIVVSTSHHEPMQRAMNEWFFEPYYQPDGSWSWIENKEKITRYFQEGAARAKGFESYFTMGMRGEGDRDIGVDDPQAVLKDIISTQRSVIKDVYGNEDDVCQLMALYKEVQGYYENGLKIPDDVTLLFSDDNFGSIRRLPYRDEASRSGGAGIYYHLEYVGVPRSYKWINTNSCARVWQQLDQAHRRGAKQIWIFNVGDLKPLEVPLSFALSLAWDIEKLNMSQLPLFFDLFSTNTFGCALSKRCSAIFQKYDKLLAIRKHEHIEPETFSLINYDEADNILARWNSLLGEAQSLYEEVDTDGKPSFFQLVLHPIKASYTYMAIRVLQAKNRLYAEQRRSSANDILHDIIRLFKEDFNLTEEYHALLDGKWNQILRQPHYGYRETWYAPSRDMISGLCLVQKNQCSNPIVGYLGISVEGHPGVRPGLCNEDSDRTHPSRRDLVPGLTLPPMEPFGPFSRWFEIFSRSNKALTWTLKVPYEWMTVTPSSGSLIPNESNQDPRVLVSIKWNSVPEDFNTEVILVLESSLGDYEHIHVPVINRVIPSGLTGFIESDKVISMGASRFDSSQSRNATVLPYIGRTAEGGVCLRRTELHGDVACLHYSFFTFTPNASSTITLYFTISLDTNPDSPLLYDLQINNGARENYRLMPEPSTTGDLPPGWEDTVMDCVWVRKHTVDLSTTGKNSLTVYLREENCVLEKIVIDLGGVRESYLGPPESFIIRR